MEPEGCVSSGEGDPVLDAAVLPDVLALDVGVGRQERGKDGRLGTLVDGERTLVFYKSICLITWGFVSSSIIIGQFGQWNSGTSKI